MNQKATKRRSDGATKGGRDSVVRWFRTGFPTFHSAFRTPHSAFVLLEVVVALGLLLVGLAVIGVQVQNSYSLTLENDQTLRAMMLAESRLAQIDSGMVEFDPAMIEAGEPIEEDFGGLFPEFASRLIIAPTAVTDLNLLALQILHVRGRVYEEDFDFDDSKVLHTLYTMRATPTTIDLQADFGADEEQVLKLSEALSEADFDPYAFDPSILAKMDLEELVAALPQLLDALGITAEQASRMIPPDVMQMLNDAGFGQQEIEETVEELEGGDQEAER